jgi:gluconate 2-dehydrogenase gamma chain
MSEDGSRVDDTADPDGTDLGSQRLSRLKLLKIGAVGAAGAAAGGLLTGQADAVNNPVTTPAPLRFLTKWEFDYVTAMAETIWPTDDLGPGARVAGVGYYIDAQLAGGWGQGHRFYLNGPFFTPADSGHGWQIPMAPSEVYRSFLPAYDAYVRQTYAKPYVDLDNATQAKALDDLRTGKAQLPFVASSAFSAADFYTLFRQNVLEGMLADPAYGGNRDMVGWKWIGNPGDPMRRGDPYYEYIFNDKPYPYEHKPLPMKPHKPKGTALQGSQIGAKPPVKKTTPKKKGAK